MKVTLTDAPQNWEILQQKDGFADLFVAGTCEELEDRILFVGVVEESSGAPVVDFVPVTPEENAFSCTVPRVPAGGLYRLEVRAAVATMPATMASLQAAVHHIGVGDNYVIAGQSNASGVGKGEIEEGTDLFVHVLRDRAYWDLATHPLDAIRDRHNPWLSFGKTLAKALHYPIGLIPTAVAGSMISSWVPSEKGELFSGMCETVSSHRVGVRGVIWYQGCSEAIACQGSTYRARVETVIEKTREAFGDPTLPILMLQINRYVDGAITPEMDENWGLVREAQRQVARTVPGVTLTPTFDTRLSDGIHLGAMTNAALGERVARQALYRIYRIGTCHDAPDIEGAVVSGENAVTLTFSNAHSLQCWAPAGQYPISVNDAEGENPVVKYGAVGDKVYLHLSRPLAGDATVSGMAHTEVPYFIVDGLTQIPMLGFFRVRVKQ